MSAPKTEPRWDLVAHLRQKIEQDPERYANGAALRVLLGKLLQDLRGASREVAPEEPA